MGYFTKAYINEDMDLVTAYFSDKIPNLQSLICRFKKNN